MCRIRQTSQVTPAQQLAVELTRDAEALARAGLTWTDPRPHQAAVVEAADALVAKLTKGGKAGQVARTTLMAALWPHGSPEQLSLELAAWWATPLGRLVAGCASHDDDATLLSRAQTAAMLDVAPGTVAALTTRTSNGLRQGAGGRGYPGVGVGAARTDGLTGLRPRTHA